MKGTSMTNMFDYAEVQFEICTGDHKDLEFDPSSFREARIQADRAMQVLVHIAQSRKPLSAFQATEDRPEGDPDGWFISMPGHAHVVRVAVFKCNALSKMKRQVK